MAVVGYKLVVEQRVFWNPKQRQWLRVVTQVRYRLRATKGYVKDERGQTLRELSSNSRRPPGWHDQRVDTFVRTMPPRRKYHFDAKPMQAPRDTRRADQTRAMPTGAPRARSAGRKQ